MYLRFCQSKKYIPTKTVNSLGRELSNLKLKSTYLWSGVNRGKCFYFIQMNKLNFSLNDKELDELKDDSSNLSLLNDGEINDSLKLANSHENNNYITVSYHGNYLMNLIIIKFNIFLINIIFF